MLIVWHQNHWMLFLYHPVIFFNTQWASLNCPNTGIELLLNEANKMHVLLKQEVWWMQVLKMYKLYILQSILEAIGC